jgi:PAS domain S-box-containing protein
MDSNPIVSEAVYGALNQMRQAILVVDYSLGILYANDRAKLIISVSQLDFNGINMIDLVVDNDEGGGFIQQLIDCLNDKSNPIEPVYCAYTNLSYHIEIKYADKWITVLFNECEIHEQNILNTEVYQQLKEKEKDIRSILENSAADIYSFDRNFIIKYINKQFQDSYYRAYQKRIDKGDSIIDALPEELRTYWQNRYGQLFEDGQKKTFRETFEFGDKKIFLEVNIYPVFVNGIVEQIVVFSKDITDITIAQMKMEANERLQKSVLDQLPSDIVIFNADHTYHYINPVAVRDAELRKWMIGRTDEDYCVFRNKPIDIARSRQSMFQRVLHTKTVESWEEMLVNKDGGREYIMRNMYPILGERNEVTHVVGYGVNITSIREAQVALQDSEERFRQLFYNNESPMLLVEAGSGIIVDANPASVKFYGWKKEQLLAKNLWDICVSSDDLLDQYNGILTSKLKRVELRQLVNYGQMREVELFCSEISINERSYVHIIAHDITDKKIAENSLLERNKQMNLIVQNIPGAVFTATRTKHYQISFISDYIEQLIGYQSKDLLGVMGISYASLIHPDDLTTVINKMDLAFVNKMRYECAYRLISRGGELIWVYEVGEYANYDSGMFGSQINGVIFSVSLQNEHQASVVLS